MKKQLVTATAAAAVLMLAQATQAAQLVATIDGAYDALCSGPTQQGYPCGYDTPSLFINNTTLFGFTNVQLSLAGYQGLNNGITQLVSVPDVAANTNLQFVWSGATTPGNLFAFDYDDEYGTSSQQVGNFDVTFTAIWQNGGAGTPIFAQFSPDNTRPFSNAAGAFVGWEGLDPNGFNETSYDAHNGTPQGVLANIYVGTPTSVPEPATLSLFGAALALLGLSRRRHKAR